jgi:hypothetical protein
LIDRDGRKDVISPLSKVDYIHSESSSVFIALQVRPTKGTQ